MDRTAGVNLILFTRDEIPRPLALTDTRARHLRAVLHRQPGESFDAGVLNGPRGRGTVVAWGQESVTLDFSWGAEPPPADNLTLLLGLPRPQTARDILRDATALGVARLGFVLTEKSDANYARSTLWSEGEWERHLVAGATQAADTRVPAVEHGRTLADALATLPVDGLRLALDNYEASAPLAGHLPAGAPPLTLAFGPERGWGPHDRSQLREHGFTLVHLGARPLRLETAVVAALAVVKSARGWP